MKSKVIFILVPSYSNNEWLDSKMMQMTKCFIEVLNNKHYPIHTVECYEDANQFLDQAEFLVIVTAGNAIIERDIIWDKLHSIPDDVGLLGHILQYTDDETPWMHEQFIIVRTSVFSKLDFSTGSGNGKAIIRSAEDMHNGNAPLYVRYSKYNMPRTYKFGTRLITDCLDKEFRVNNFDQEWRWPKTSSGYVKGKFPCRGFCYPKKNPTLFEKALKTLTLLDGLDEAQEMFIIGIQQALKFNVLNAWSYDEVVVTNAKHIISPANGFLGEMMAFKSGATSLTFYDKNPNNIEFKKHLYSNWDGNDYTSFATIWAKERNLALEPVLNSTQEMSNSRYPDIEETFYPMWNEWRKTVSVNFLHCDLIHDWELIEDTISNDTAIHTSTILTMFPFTHIIYSNDEINAVRKALRASIGEWIES